MRPTRLPSHPCIGTPMHLVWAHIYTTRNHRKRMPQDCGDGGEGQNMTDKPSAEQAPAGQPLDAVELAEVTRWAEESVYGRALLAQGDELRSQLAELAQELNGDGTPLQIAVQRREMWFQEYKLRVNAEAQLSTTREIARRWNRAASKYAAGSEFIDDPERVFAQIEKSLDMRVKIRTKVLREIARELARVCQLALNAFENNWAIDWNELSAALAKARDAGLLDKVG